MTCAPVARRRNPSARRSTSSHRRFLARDDSASSVTRRVRASHSSRACAADARALSITSLSALDRDRAFQTEDGMARHVDALAAILADQLTHARRDLARGQALLTQAPGPVRRRCAVRRAGHRVPASILCGSSGSTPTRVAACAPTDRCLDSGRSVLSGSRVPSWRGGGVVKWLEQCDRAWGTCRAGAQRPRAIDRPHQPATTSSARREARTPTARAVPAACAKSTVLIRPPTRRTRSRPGRRNRIVVRTRRPVSFTNSKCTIER